MTGTPAHPQRVSDSSTQPALLRSRAISPRRFMEVCPYDFVRRRISSAELSGKLLALRQSNGCLHGYSSRKTCMGSTRAARIAGTSEATAATTSTMRTTAKEVAISEGETP